MNFDPNKDSLEIEYQKQEIQKPVEDLVISGESFVVPKLEKLDVEIEAKRPGPKSSAQTPAKPSERRKGSSKNKPGSAGEDGAAITFSAKIIQALKTKVKEHNSKYSRKVTLGQLKKVFRRGAGAYSVSHRPGISRTAWGLARVNAFLRMVKGDKVKQSYRKADKDLL